MYRVTVKASKSLEPMLFIRAKDLSSL